MSSPVPNVATVCALPGHRLAVGWRNGGEDVVDFRAVLASHPAFLPLRDETAFAAVHVADWGGGIKWDSEADYAADALHALALEQREAVVFPQPERLEDLLAGYDVVEVKEAVRGWLDDVPKGKGVL